MLVCCTVCPATQVYRRDKFNCYSCVEADAYNFYAIDYDNPIEPPLESHPIPFRHIESGRFWIWKQYNPFLKQEKPSSQTVLRDDYTETKGKAVHIVSDASVYIKDRKAAGAWHMFHVGEPQRRVAIPLEHHLFGHSYRSELETFYHALVDADNILQHPHTIHQYMDCKAGLETLEQPLFKPSQTMAPDMDVVMAYRDLRSRIKHSLQAEWVMGHADTKKKDKPETITPIEHENIECDAEAEQFAMGPTPSHDFQPLPGYKAMLQLDGNWVTTHFRESVQFANTAPDLYEYATQRLGITDAQFHLINWQALALVRRTHGIARTVRVSKMIYRWMPVGHNWNKCGLTSDKCPGCGKPDETFEHVLTCPNERMASVRTKGIESILKISHKEKIPLKVHEAYFGMVLNYLKGNDETITSSHAKVQEALDSQYQLGAYHLIVGLQTTKWIQALEACRVDYAPKMAAILLEVVWDKICEPLWMERNNILHHTKSFVSIDECDSAKDKLLWYARHSNEVLDYRHQFLTEGIISNIDQWTYQTCRAKLEMLNNARDYYEVQCNQHQARQRTIYDWIHGYKELRSGRLIGHGLVDAWVYGRRPPPPTHTYDDDSTSTEEAEFDWDPNNESDNDE